MRTYDYFLYDNRTRSTWGRDWGLKAATGELAERADLKQRFNDYCHLSFDTSRGSLTGFDFAVGGLRAPHGGGYLLCVTLESLDHIDRPTCAVVGIWLRDLREFRSFLGDRDPVASARAVLTAGELPERLAGIRAGAEVSRRSIAWSGFPIGAAVTVREFLPGKTPSEVLSSLRRQARIGTRAPSILGITARIVPEQFRAAGLDVVYCLPTDPVSRTALEEHQRTAVLGPTGPEFDAVSPDLLTRIRQRWQALHRAVKWSLVGGLVMLLVAVVVVWTTDSWIGRDRLPEARTGVTDQALADVIPGANRDSDPPQVSVPVVDTPSPEPPSDSTSESVDSQRYLAEVAELVERLEALDPRDLLATRAYRILREVDVADRFRDRRLAYRELLETGLPRISQRLLTGKGVNLPYYFSRSLLDRSSAKRAETIRSLLRQEELPTEPCRGLEWAFGFEFRDSRATLPLWCSTISEIARLASD